MVLLSFPLAPFLKATNFMIFVVKFGFLYRLRLTP